MGFEIEGFDELLNTLEELSNNPMDFFEGNVLTLVCPMCEEESDIEILSNNKGKCLKCSEEIELNITIENE